MHRLPGVRRRVALAALAGLAALGLVLVACARPASVTPTPRASKAPPNYAFILANPVGLLALDAKGQILGQIGELPTDSSPTQPTLSPDRKSIAFSITLAPSGNTATFGSDIWLIDLDGTNMRKLLEHERENVFYNSPQFDPSGKSLYVQRRAAIVQNGTYVGNEDTVEKVDLTTKQRTRVVDHAVDPTLSPDGKTLVYVRYDDRGTPQGLWRIGTDGTDNRKFFTTTDTWWYLQSPSFSPDGKWLVFSGAGHNAKSLRGDTKLALRGDMKLAHLGIPSEIFQAPVDGKSVKVLGQTGDDTVLAWSPDGSRLIYVAAGALQIMTLADNKVEQLQKGDNFYFGWIVWVKK